MNQSIKKTLRQQSTALLLDVLALKTEPPSPAERRLITEILQEWEALKQKYSRRNLEAMSAETQAALINSADIRTEDYIICKEIIWDLFEILLDRNVDFKLSREAIAYLQAHGSLQII